jgi:hypothetical protein
MILVKKRVFFFKSKTTRAKNFFQKKKFHFTFFKKFSPPLPKFLVKFIKKIS